VIITTNENVMDRFRQEQNSGTDGVVRRLFMIDFHTKIENLLERGTTDEAEKFKTAEIMNLD
jgi:hypothetical protein